ncbi:MAG: hypothetical protein HRT90_09460, partial [Candidatus Margulisbacteria bacterium]|nr:hypothetical protein [Candidatus Margulisiibacteriota bacterium]
STSASTTVAQTAVTTQPEAKATTSDNEATVAETTSRTVAPFPVETPEDTSGESTASDSSSEERTQERSATEEKSSKNPQVIQNNNNNPGIGTTLGIVGALLGGISLIAVGVRQVYRYVRPAADGGAPVIIPVINKVVGEQKEGDQPEMQGDDLEMGKGGKPRGDAVV